MNILMISHGYPPTVSGVTLVVQKVARAMARRGHRVLLVTASEHGEPYRAVDEGVELLRVRSVANPFWKEAPLPYITHREFEQVAAEFRPDILHAHEAAFLSLQLLRLGTAIKRPVVATCYYVPRFVASYLTWGDEPAPVVQHLTWTYSIWLFDHFDRVAFATRAHEKYFVERGLRAPTAIISNGLDLQRYHPPVGSENEEDIAGRYNLPAHPRILFVSRLARDKEIDVLFQALHRICGQLECHLLLIGRGDDRPRLEGLVEELGLQQRVSFLGFVPEQDVPALYRQCDLFAIASCCEVQSIPTMQAVATGLPVVAVDALALPELVHDGENGFLVSPRDAEAMAQAMLRILRDPALAARMGQAGLAVARPHDEQTTFDLYEQLYKQAVVERVENSTLS